MQLNLKNPLACLDLETTGVNLIHDRIIEIAIIKLMPNGDRLVFEKRINPEKNIPIEASLVHNIYDKDVQDKPTFKQIAKSLCTFLKGADLAGFNLIRFDLPMLMEHLLRANIEFKLENRNIIDVQKIFHLMEKRTLKAAYSFYCQKELKDAHSAMADTKATLDILIEQVKRYDHLPVIDALGNSMGIIQNDVEALHKLINTKMIDLANRMVYNDQQIPIFNFGKYKGKVVTEVLKSDPSYYTWMLQGDFTLDTKRKLTQIKLGIL